MSNESLLSNPLVYIQLIDQLLQETASNPTVGDPAMATRLHLIIGTWLWIVSLWQLKIEFAISRVDWQWLLRFAIVTKALI